jgi:hypothetical protein
VATSEATLAGPRGATLPFFAGHEWVRQPEAKRFRMTLELSTGPQEKRSGQLLWAPINPARNAEKIRIAEPQRYPFESDAEG